MAKTWLLEKQKKKKERKRFARRFTRSFFFSTKNSKMNVISSVILALRHEQRVIKARFSTLHERDRF